VNHHLGNLTEFAINYYQNLLNKVWQREESGKQEIQKLSINPLKATSVAANNLAKLYENRAVGFVALV